MYKACMLHDNNKSILMRHAHVSLSGVSVMLISIWNFIFLHLSWFDHENNIHITNASSVVGHIRSDLSWTISNNNNNNRQSRHHVVKLRFIHSKHWHSFGDLWLNKTNKRGLCRGYLPSWDLFLTDFFHKQL